MLFSNQYLSFDVLHYVLQTIWNYLSIYTFKRFKINAAFYSLVFYNAFISSIVGYESNIRYTLIRDRGEIKKRNADYNAYYSVGVNMDLKCESMLRKEILGRKKNNASGEPNISHLMDRLKGNYAQTKSGFADKFNKEVKLFKQKKIIQNVSWIKTKFWCLIYTL